MNINSAFTTITKASNQLTLNADEKRLHQKIGGNVDGLLDEGEIRQLSDNKVTKEMFKKYAGTDNRLDANEYAKLREDHKDIKFEVKA